MNENLLLNPAIITLISIIIGASIGLYIGNGTLGAIIMIALTVVWNLIAMILFLFDI